MLGGRGGGTGTVSAIGTGLLGGGGGCRTPLPAGTPEMADGGGGAKAAATSMAAGEAVLPRLPLGPIWSGTCTFGCAALNFLRALGSLHLCCQKSIKFQLLLFFLELGFAFPKFGLLLLGQLCHLLLISQDFTSCSNFTCPVCYFSKIQWPGTAARDTFCLKASLAL